MTDDPDTQAEPESNFAEFEATATKPEGERVADDKPDPSVNDKTPAKEGDDDTLELGGDDAPEMKDADGKTRSRHPAQRINHYRAIAGQAERERDEARAELARLKGEGGAKVETLDEIKAKEPKADDFEFGAADPDYLEARQDWKLDVREAERAEASRKNHEQTAAVEKQRQSVTELTGKLETQVEAGKAAYDDFEAVVNAAAEAREEPMSPVVTVAIAESPVGSDVLYHLAKDTAAQARIDGEVAKALDTITRAREAGQPFGPQAFNGAALAFGELEGQFLPVDHDDADLDLSDPLDVMRMNGRMKARLSGKAKASGTVRKITSAPEPPEQRSRGANGQFRTDAATTNFAEFERMANKKAAR